MKKIVVEVNKIMQDQVGTKEKRLTDGWTNIKSYKRFFMVKLNYKYFIMYYIYDLKYKLV